ARYDASSAVMDLAGRGDGCGGQRFRGLLTRTMNAPLVLVLVAASASGGAAGSSALSEQRALALELVALVQPESSYRASIEQMTDQMLPQMDAQARASGKALPPDFRKKFIAMMEDVTPYDESIEWASELYAQRFTASELKQLIAFYKTPL